MKKLLIATLVAILLVGFGCVSAYAASNRNYSDWAEDYIEQLNAVDCDTNLTRNATREEVTNLVGYVLDEYNLLPSKSNKDFVDEDDFESSRSYKMATKVAEAGVICGYPGWEFIPDGSITRAEFTKIFNLTADLVFVGTDGRYGYRYSSYNYRTTFDDIEGHWAQNYIELAYEKGIVQGRSSSRFAPDNTISREEVIKMFVELLGESNNPLITAVDNVYGLEFDNSYYVEDRYYDDDDDYRYNDRYYDDDDYEDATKRPSVDTGDYSSSSSSSSSSKRPTRPVVDTTTNTDSTESTESTKRPSVDTEETASSRPTRPTV